MMTRRFQPLALTAVAAPPQLPESRGTATPDDPARRLMTDLRHGPRVVADHLDGLDTTLTLMLRAGVHMALVAGVDGVLIGHVTRDDLQGERPVQRALADHLHHDELALEHVMTPLAAWQVLDEALLDHARGGDIVATLAEHSLRYLPVLAHGGQLVGLFSARRIEQALGQVIGADLHSRNFAELEATLAR